MIFLFSLVELSNSTQGNGVEFAARFLSTKLKCRIFFRSPAISSANLALGKVGTGSPCNWLDFPGGGVLLGTVCYKREDEDLT